MLSTFFYNVEVSFYYYLYFPLYVIPTFIIYLACNRLHQTKLKAISDTVFHALCNHQGEVVIDGRMYICYMWGSNTTLNNVQSIKRSWTIILMLLNSTDLCYSILFHNVCLRSLTPLIILYLPVVWTKFILVY